MEHSKTLLGAVVIPACRLDTTLYSISAVFKHGTLLLSNLETSDSFGEVKVKVFLFQIYKNPTFSYQGLKLTGL